MKRIILIVLCLFALLDSTNSYSQVDLDQILKGGPADANYLAQGYMAPALNAIGSGLNQGWYNTAATHKLFGFDLTMSGSLMYFPTGDQTYHVDNNKLTTLKLVSPSDGNVPTVFGGTSTPTYGYKSFPGTFQGPAGAELVNKFGAFPLPIFNVGIGMPKNTDLKLRIVPGVEVGGTKVTMYGAGIMHDIKQYIPGIKEAPIDLSVFFGYTSFKSEASFGPPGQVGTTDFTATTIQGVVGKKFAFLTVYGSAGYNFASGNFKATGTYTDTVTGVSFTDPVNISTSTSGPRFGGGLRLKFAIFTLHGDYTFQTYNTLTVGFGIAVR
jgi:hypothetical protein